MASRTRKYFDLVDGVWADVRTRLPNPFTTQDFQRRLEDDEPAIWAEFVERWGPGGKGSGNFYSPANVLNNYLKDKTRNGILLDNRFVPSSKGWGSTVVNQWQFVSAAVLPASEEDWEFAEGKQKWRSHLFRERDAGVRRRLLHDRATTGICCDICGATGDHLPEEARHAMFEAHHASEPMSVGERKTKKQDMALLCACCHRLLHRLVTTTGEWVSVNKAKELLSPRYAAEKRKSNVA